MTLTAAAMISDVSPTSLIENYKVGDVYLTTTNHGSGSNVAIHFGYGTWAEAWVGLAIFGAGSNTDTRGEAYTLTAGVEFGEKNHALVEDENGPHTHTYLETQNPSTGFGDNSSNQSNATKNTGSSGLGTAHNTMPPGMALYVWERTA